MLATALAPVIGYDAAADARQGGAQDRPDDPRAGPRAGHPAGRSRRAARPGRDDPGSRGGQGGGCVGADASAGRLSAATAVQSRRCPTTRLWDRAAAIRPCRAGRRPPELVALPDGRPSLAEPVHFMRDAELRFQTLRMRIEERRCDRSTASGRDASRSCSATRATQGRPPIRTGRPPATTSSGSRTARLVRTYSGVHQLGTQRPVRRRVVGLDDPTSRAGRRVYDPLTALPSESLPRRFVHPAGLLPERARDRRLPGSSDRSTSSGARRSSSSATIRARSRSPADRRTTSSRSRSTARPADPPAGRDDRRRGDPRRHGHRARAGRPLRRRRSTSPSRPAPRCSTDRPPTNARTPGAMPTAFDVRRRATPDQASSVQLASIAASSSGVPWTLGPLNQFLAETKYQIAAPPRTTRNTTGV